MNLNFETFFSNLEEKLSSIWSDIFASSKLTAAIDSGKIDKRLYIIYMIETYHYTSHNAKNQAMVALRDDVTPIYAKFCLSHAADEIGHEKMALHDVMSIGFDPSKCVLQQPLHETECLIAYLYWIAKTGNPVQRLGYSYWAENCYKYIDHLIEKIKTCLALDTSQMTFFVAHAAIDADHFEDVKTIIRRTCKNEEDLLAIEAALETTLRMTGKMLDGVCREYHRMLDGKSSRYFSLTRPTAES